MFKVLLAMVVVVILHSNNKNHLSSNTMIGHLALTVAGNSMITQLRGTYLIAKIRPRIPRPRLEVNLLASEDEHNS